MKTWLYDWTISNIRSARKQLSLLQQRAYASGLTTIRPVASPQVHQLMDSWKQAPASAPLTGLQELLDWTPDTKPFQSLLKATVQLSRARRQESQAQRPRLLVCHDLNGNYHSDALPQGSGDADYYRLTQWSSIDVFVYFSHALVTIPPPGWINAAHTNGVPILGTFITEWEAGSILCELLLWTEQSAEAAALQLANIAAFYGFDGWLLNIENPILHRHVPNLVHFIRVLRRVMHEMVPGSQVIWYDAVTTEGILQWQDTLNHLNMPFFEAADAIFINYTWKEGTPSQAAAVAGARKHDVYMGVDVFGRNTYGGGGMSCNVALTAAKSAGLSAALFAPAWVWEVGDRTDWLQRQQAFWDSIQACWELPRALVCQLPFSTSFDQGAGSARFSQGELVLRQPWYNLSCQSPQPSLRLPSICYNPFNSTFLRANTAEGPLSASLCTDLAFQLGGCLQIKGAVKPGTSSSIEIFTADLVIPPPGLQVAFTFKPSLPPSQLQLELWCWMEPSNSDSNSNSNSNSIDNPTSTASFAGAISGVKVGGSESGARATRPEARTAESEAKATKSWARATESGDKRSESGTGVTESGARETESGARATESGARTAESGASIAESGARATESGARAAESGARATESGARAIELGGRGCKSRPRPSAFGVAANELGGEASELGASGSKSRATMLAMLQAGGAVIVANEQEAVLTDGQGARAVAQLALEQRVHHSGGWLTVYSRLPSHLPDFSCLTLRSIEVAAVAAANPPANLPSNPPANPLLTPPVNPCLGYVGSIAITEWNQAVQEPQVPGITFQDITWTAATSGDSAASETQPSASQGSSAATTSAGSPSHALSAFPIHQDSSVEADATASSISISTVPVASNNNNSTIPSAIWLYATLNFEPAVPHAASRFEVFFKTCVGSSSVTLASSTTGWGWLGTTESTHFRATQLEVPLNSTSVEFAVQAADVLGKLTPFESATFAMLQRP